MEDRYDSFREQVDTFGLESPFAEALFVGENDAPYGGSAAEDEQLAWLDSEARFGETEMFGEFAWSETEAPDSGGSGALEGGVVWTTKADDFGAPVTCFLPPAALKAREFDVLVYIHGLLHVCGWPSRGMEELIASPKSPFAKQIAQSGRPILLVVPQLQMTPGKGTWTTKGLDRPGVLGRLVKAAIAQAGQRAGLTGASARSIVVAGHSRAYGVLYPIVRALAKDRAAASAIGPIRAIWMLDSNYPNWGGGYPSRELRKLSTTMPGLAVTVVYRKGSATDLFRGKSGGTAPKLVGIPASISHCALPSSALPKLLSATPDNPAVDSRQEWQGEWQDEARVDGQDEWQDESRADGQDEWRDESRADGQDEWLGETRADGQDEWLGEFRADGQDEWQREWEDEWRDAWLGEAATPAGASGDPFDRAGLTTAEKTAILITSTFETGEPGGFHGLTGSFDGQGLSFGLLNWNIGSGSLQPLLRQLAGDQPARWKAIFQNDAERFLAVIKGSTKQDIAAQLNFAKDVMGRNDGGRRRVAEPWMSYFKALSADPDFRQIQIAFARKSLASAYRYCRLFGLKSERALALMFDLVAQQGAYWFGKARPERTRKLTARLDFLKRILPPVALTEKSILSIIADTVAETSKAEWRNQVQARKRWFVTGEHTGKGAILARFHLRDVPFVETVRLAHESEWQDEYLADLADEDLDWAGEAESFHSDFEHQHDEEDFEVDEEEESGFDLAPADAVSSFSEYLDGSDMPSWQPKTTAPLAVPPKAPLDFAATPPPGSYWPIRTTHKQKRLISYLYQGKKKIELFGHRGRNFLADRRVSKTGPYNRYHVGIDLFCRRNEPVFACEAGVIVGFSFFYKARSGQRTYRLMIQHRGSGVVANYGEVRPDSLKKNGLQVGSEVRAGQQIGFVSDTDMIHFETYRPGADQVESAQTLRFYKTDKKPPARLLNPTRYLLFLSETGIDP